MAVFTIGSDGASTNNAIVNLSIIAAGDDMVITNPLGSAITVQFESFNNALTGTINNPNDTRFSQTETLTSGGMVKVGSESYLHVRFANSSASAHNVGISVNGIQTTHGTSAQSGEEVFIGLV